MQVNVQRLSPVLVEFDVEIAVDRVKSEVEKAYLSVAKTAKVRGFRPGKAPRKVLSHLYGPRIAMDVAQRLVDESYPQAISEQKLQPVTDPAIEPRRPAQKGDLATIDFTLSVEGQLIEDAGSTDFQAELGVGTLIPEIEEALIG